MRESRFGGSLSNLDEIKTRCIFSYTEKDLKVVKKWHLSRIQLLSKEMNLKNNSMRTLAFRKFVWSEEGRFFQSPPAPNFCLNGPIDLKLQYVDGIWKNFSILKKLGKNYQKVVQNADISIFQALIP